MGSLPLSRSLKAPDSASALFLLRDARDIKYQYTSCDGNSADPAGCPLSLCCQSSLHKRAQAAAAALLWQRGVGSWIQLAREALKAVWPH